MYLPRVCLQICTYVVALHMFPLSHYDLFQVGNKDMTRVLLYNICWHIFCSLTLNHQNCRTILLLTAHKTFLGFFCSLVSLAAHRFGHVEFRKSNICFDFFNCACLRKTSTNIRNSTRPNRWATKDIKQFLLKAYTMRK